MGNKDLFYPSRTSLYPENLHPRHHTLYWCAMSRQKSLLYLTIPFSWGHLFCFMVCLLAVLNNFVEASD